MKLYTVKIVGGAPFSFQLKGNPSFTHSGGTSAGNLMLSEVEVQTLRGLTLVNGGSAEIWEVEGQSEEQAALRKGLLWAGREEEPRWATPTCPGCPWFAPEKPSGCGVVSWPAEQVTELLRTSQPHQEAVEGCSEPGVPQSLER